MKPTISIIVPVYNVEAYLIKCLDSILAQRFTDYEVILVNDGSTDESGAICEEYADKDIRIKVYHQKNKGVSSARNVGISQAKGRYIGFVDGDDYITNDMYKTLYRLCQETESDVAICKLGREINGQFTNCHSDEVIVTHKLNNLEAMRELFKGNLYRFSLCNKLFSNTCFENIVFPGGRIHEDLSTTYKLMSRAKNVVYTNYLGYIYVKQKDSLLTSAYYKKRLEAFIAWDEIIIYMNEQYEELMNEFISSFTYWCIDNIYLIVNQVRSKEERVRYLNTVRKYIRKYYWRIIKTKHIPLKYKYLVTIIGLHTKLFIFSDRIKTFIIWGNKGTIESSNS